MKIAEEKKVSDILAELLNALNNLIETNEVSQWIKCR